MISPLPAMIPFSHSVGTSAADCFPLLCPDSASYFVCILLFFSEFTSGFPRVSITPFWIK